MFCFLNNKKRKVHLKRTDTQYFFPYQKSKMKRNLRKKKEGRYKYYIEFSFTISNFQVLMAE